MNKWVNLNEAEEKRLKEQEQQIKANNKQLEQFLLDQMNANPNSVKLTNDVAIKRKFELGGQMNPEEARMNRELLKEIARAKKEGVSVRNDTASLSQAI